MTGPETRPIRLGLGANAGQFAVLVGVSALVGGMVGQERTVLPLLADEVFGLTGFTVALTFLVAFGLTRAFTNLAAGGLADRFGLPIEAVLGGPETMYPEYVQKLKQAAAGGQRR